MRPEGTRRPWLRRLDVLVNNAGICDDGPIEQQSLEDLRRVIEVNLISLLDLCRLTAPLLLAARPPA
jgi:NAD(P)-dependent dehydrogenase (short-subunit alcohol dehydrogenase family)